MKNGYIIYEESVGSSLGLSGFRYFKAIDEFEKSLGNDYQKLSDIIVK